MPSIRELMDFNPGSEEYCIDIPRLREDGVCDASTLKPEKICPLPELSLAVSSDLLLGIDSAGDRMLVPLDIKKLMAGAELGLVAETTQ